MALGGSGARRAAYAGLAALCAVLLWLVNVAPGWQAWGFLTADMAQDVALLNLALVVGVLGNIAVLVRDTPLLRGLRDALAATFVLILLARLFVDFPFDVDSSAWRGAMRAAMGLLMVASFFGLVTGWSKVARAVHVHVHLRR